MDEVGICNFIALLLMLSVFGSFFWAIKNFFYINIDTKKNKLISIKLLSIILVFIQLIGIMLSPGIFSFSYSMGILLYFYSLTLFWWAVLTNKKFIFPAVFSSNIPNQLIINGPYLYIRHPFYSAYLAAWLAAPVISQQWYLLFTTGIMLVIYFCAAKQEERKFSQSTLSQKYLAYKKNTGMFIPKLKCLSNKTDQL
jgi:protein-S-isoprenylcysteine O-methyltransferase Ste14